MHSIEDWQASSHELWVGAMALLINSKKSKVFRWHDSGDVQDEATPNKNFCCVQAYT